MKIIRSLFLLPFFIFAFQSCSDDDNTFEQEQPKEENILQLSGIDPIKPDSKEIEWLPMSFDKIDWKYLNDKLISYKPRYAVNINPVNVIEHSETILKSEGNYTGFDTTHNENFSSTIEIENGRIKKEIVLSTYNNLSVAKFIKEYHYNAEGYLQYVTESPYENAETKQTILSLTWENGNLVKAVSIDRIFETTYEYKYDNEPYVPMSDFAPYTPLWLYGVFPFKEFYNKMGNNNKNNVVEVNITYPNQNPSYDIMKLTYKTILNEDKSINRISHSGTYYPHYDDKDYKLLSFEGMSTFFLYSSVEN